MKPSCLLSFWSFVICLALAASLQPATAQTFEVYKGDTINRTDTASQKQGRWLVFNSDGAVKDFAKDALMEESFYRNGKREGLRKQFFANGKIKSEVNYKANRPSGFAKFYYPNGNLAEEGNWIFGGWDGKYKNYYKEGGGVNEDLSYTYGKKDGLQKQYHPNGKLKMEGTWKNGQPDGVVKEYNEAGHIVSEIKYNNGEVNEKETKYYVVEETSNFIEQVDSIGDFTGTGNFKLKNKMGLVSREGYFSSGLLVDGKQFFYTPEGQKTKTVFFEKGKAVKTEGEK